MNTPTALQTVSSFVIDNWATALGIVVAIIAATLWAVFAGPRFLLSRIPADLKAEMLAKVPVTPGRYLSDGGHDWELRPDGHWYDRHGITQPTPMNFLLGQYTFVRLPDLSETVPLTV